MRRLIVQSASDASWCPKHTDSSLAHSCNTPTLPTFSRPTSRPFCHFTLESLVIYPNFFMNNPNWYVCPSFPILCHPAKSKSPRFCCSNVIRNCLASPLCLWRDARPSQTSCTPTPTTTTTTTSIRFKDGRASAGTVGSLREGRVFRSQQHKAAACCRVPSNAPSECRLERDAHSRAGHQIPPHCHIPAAHRCSLLVVAWGVTPFLWSCKEPRLCACYVPAPYKTLRYRKTSLYARMKLFFKHVSHYSAKTKWKHIFFCFWHLGISHVAVHKFKMVKQYSMQSKYQNSTKTHYGLGMPAGMARRNHIYLHCITYCNGYTDHWQLCPFDLRGHGTQFGVWSVLNSPSHPIPSHHSF